MIINQKVLEADITNIINTFERLMDESNKSIIPVKSRHVDDLALFENMYIRARSKHASLLGKPVLVVSSVSVFITNQGCFSTQEISCQANVRIHWRRMGVRVWLLGA
ncbi:hypothetical protein [Klebsiella pneumoniae]|uniref:hypothetical protein n=1 Tax=Klebsiella pneumoniae TaxID=573 RepID=UPI0035A260B8